MELQCVSKHTGKIGINVGYFNKTDNPGKGSPVVLYSNKKPVTVYSFRLIKQFLGVFM